MLDGPETPRTETWLLISGQRPGDLNLPDTETAHGTDLQQSHLDCCSYGVGFKDNLGEKTSSPSGHQYLSEPEKVLITKI